MPENLKKKIEGMNEAAKSANSFFDTIKKTIIKATGILFLIIIVVGGGVGWVWKNKAELGADLMKGITKEYIHNEVVEETNHTHTQDYEELVKRVGSVEGKVRGVWSGINGNTKLIKDLRADLDAVIIIQEGSQKHLKYLSGGVSNLVKAIIQEMESKESESCNFEWYETNGGKDWLVIYADAYNCDMIHELKGGQNCKGYYIDLLNNAKIVVGQN